MPSIDLRAGDLLGKVAPVAAATALISSLFAPALRSDVVVQRLADPTRRAVFAVLRTGRDFYDGVQQLRAAIHEATATWPAPLPTVAKSISFRCDTPTVQLILPS